VDTCDAFWSSRRNLIWLLIFVWTRGTNDNNIIIIIIHRNAWDWEVANKWRSTIHKSNSYSWTASSILQYNSYYVVLAIISQLINHSGVISTLRIFLMLIIQMKHFISMTEFLKTASLKSIICSYVHSPFPQQMHSLTFAESCRRRLHLKSDLAKRLLIEFVATALLIVRSQFKLFINF
jgi:hypothetical protein